MPACAVRGDLNRYVSLLGGRFGADLVSVVLFGSRARGETRPDGNIDVLVIIRGLPRRRFERYDGCRDLARAVSGEFGRAAAPILLTPEEAEDVKPYLQRARARRIAVEALFGARGYADVVRESQDRETLGQLREALDGLAADRAPDRLLALYVRLLALAGAGG